MRSSVLRVELTSTREVESKTMSFSVRPLAVAIRVVVVALVIFGAAVATAITNLLPNGELSLGSGNMPEFWKAETIVGPKSEEQQPAFSWTRNGTGGELRLRSEGISVLQWVQSLMLSPGWYRLSAEMNAAISDPTYSSATVAVIPREDYLFGVLWSGSSKTGIWTSGHLDFRVANNTRTIQIVCQLSGAGDAAFRKLSVVSLSGPPQQTEASVDLGALPPQRRHAATTEGSATPGGVPDSIIAALLIAAIVGFFGYALLARRNNKQ